MLKVLILAYDFPPLASAGAQRPYSWYRYLKEFGVYPVVVTRHWDKASVDAMGFVSASLSSEMVVDMNDLGTVIRTPYFPNPRDKMLLRFGEKRMVLIRKILSFLLSFLKFYLRKFDNTKNIYFAAENYLKNNPVDLIISTGEPFILFHHASVLSRKFRIPYILDYRDGWTESIDLEQNQPRLKILNRLLFRKLEQRYLLSAHAVITASNSYIPNLKKINSEKKYFEILNGYFEEEYSGKIKRSGHRFNIVYSGRIYKFQPVEDFLDVMIEMASGELNIPVTIQFIGAVHDEILKSRINEYLNNSIIDIQLLPRTDYNDYAEKLVNADVLLLLSDDRTGWLNAKLFDYLPTGNNIILFRNDHGVMEEIISGCDAGFVCSDSDELKGTLTNIFNEYRLNGSLECKSSGFEIFSRRNQVGKLAEIIKQCVE